MCLYMAENLEAGEHWLCARRAMDGMLIKDVQHVLELTDQQVFLVLVVRVEGRASHVGAVDDVLDADLVVALLAHQRHQGRRQRLARALRAAIRLGALHMALPGLCPHKWRAMSNTPSRHTIGE